MVAGYKTGGRQRGSLNKATRDVKLLAQTYGPRVILGLAELAGLEPLEQGREPPSEWARVAAMKELLDRAYGKASQVLASDPESPLQFVIRAPPVVSSTEEWLERYAPKTINGTAVEKTEGHALDAASEGPAAEPAPPPAAQPPTNEAWLEANKPKGRDYG